MKKILFCASTLSHLRNFHLPYLQAFRQAGWEVWAAADQEGPLPGAHRVVSLPFVKSMASPKNLRAVLAARALLAGESFDAVSLHTTLAAAVVRAAALTLRRRPKIFCTCHGYLFSREDGPARLKYLLPERLCAPVTDVLMVMNREDQRIAVENALSKTGEVRFIPGMGVDFSPFAPWPRERRLRRREELGLSPEDFVFVYGAEFSPRKNQAFLLRAFAAMAGECPRARLLLAGEGALLEECRALCRSLGLEGRVLFPGHVPGMASVLGACDAAVSSSRSEGLPFNIMEAMAAGLPVAASRVKGHTDLLREGESGLLFSLDSPAGAAQAMKLLYQSPNLRERLAASAAGELPRYSLEQVLPQILEIYRDALPGCL